MKLKFLLKKWLKLKFSTVFTSYLGPSANAILVQLSDMKLLVPASDLSFVRHLNREKSYNKPLVDFLLNEITEQSSVLFVGTHIGSVLIPVAKKAKRVVGIEANPSTFELLSSNIVLNGLSNVELHNLAAFDQKTELEFLANTDNTGGSKIAFEGTSDLLFRVDGTRRIKIPGDRLDTLLSGQKFDLIVMDIEGSEHKALMGMTGLLAACDKIVLEILPISIEKVARISPQEFFNAVPNRFHHAVPIHTSYLEKNYGRQDYLKMYEAIVRHDEMIGSDILFKAT